jgi:hypothetical protein
MAERRANPCLAAAVFVLAAAACAQPQEVPRDQAAALRDVVPRRRIVDPEKFPPKKSAARKFFMAPVRALNFTITGVADLAGRLPIGGLAGAGKDAAATEHRHLHKKLLYGGLGEGSGIGAGVALSTADLLSRDFEVSTSVAVTLQRYFDTRAGFAFDPTGSEKRRFRIVGGGRYQLRPKEDFSGIGPESSEFDRTTYDQQERSARLGAELQPHARVLLAAGVDYSSTSIFPGRDDRFPTTQQLFTPSEVPGLTGGRLFGPYALVQLDGRDVATDPRSGAWLTLGVGDSRSVDGNRFAFTSYRVDGRTYLPLGTRRRVLALRVLGLFNDPRGGSDVPFFRMARLGDYETLRGYPSYRFYGNNALSGNVEYRWQLVEQLRAFMFADFGQVFDRASQLSVENARATFGGGFEAHAARNFVFRIFVGKSPQETRVFLKLNRGF